MEEKPKRRKRYSGKNPRRFEDKYKEHRQDQVTISKVMTSGKTPAGTHRPILVNEVLDALGVRAGQRGVDATLGYGGHAEALLKRLQPAGELLAMDVDSIELPRTTARLRLAGYDETKLQICHSNYAGIYKALARCAWKNVDFILADLGCSSMQYDDPTRGFSHKFDGPLDLRMNPDRGLAAWQWLAKQSESTLAAILERNADEPHAAKLAAAIHAHPIRTTAELAQVVRQVIATLAGPIQRDEGEKPLRRTFQALRIAVNEEFSALERFLAAIPDCLVSEGRVAILSFHSGEDRRVKKAFKAGVAEGFYSAISDFAIRPAALEIRANPRASSAKLRWAIRA